MFNHPPVKGNGPSHVSKVNVLFTWNGGRTGKDHGLEAGVKTSLEPPKTKVSKYKYSMAIVKVFNTVWKVYVMANLSITTRLPALNMTGNVIPSSQDVGGKWGVIPEDSCKEITTPFRSLPKGGILYCFLVIVVCITKI